MARKKVNIKIAVEIDDEKIPLDELIDMVEDKVNCIKGAVCVDIDFTDNT